MLHLGLIVCRTGIANAKESCYSIAAEMEETDYMSKLRLSRRSLIAAIAGYQARARSIVFLVLLPKLQWPAARRWCCSTPALEQRKYLGPTAGKWAPHNIRVNAVAPAGFCSIVVQAKGWSTIPTRSAAARIPAIVSSFSGMPSTAYFRSNSASSNPGG
jgi:hypothetical protein